MMSFAMIRFIMVHCNLLFCFYSEYLRSFDAFADADHDARHSQQTLSFWWERYNSPERWGIPCIHDYLNTYHRLWIASSSNSRFSYHLVSLSTLSWPFQRPWPTSTIPRFCKPMLVSRYTSHLPEHRLQLCILVSFVKLLHVIGGIYMWGTI